MSTSMKVAIVSYSMAVVLLAVFGLVYLFRPEFMPYHADAVATAYVRRYTPAEPPWTAALAGILLLVGFIASLLAGQGRATLPDRPY